MLIDLWNILNPQKLITMIMALVFIQIFGTYMNRALGARMGAILTGFFGGLVSSTATTASLAKKSKASTLNKNTNPPDEIIYSNEILIFLSATAAMLIEGLVIVFSGTSRFHLTSMIIFLGPLLTTGLMIIFYSRKIPPEPIITEEKQFQIFPIIKLSVFIISIIFISKLLQKVFGQNGLMILTFLVSLFEIHGSVIANVQLHENNSINVTLLGHLLAISIIASYLSKIFLIWTLGNTNLRSQAIKCTLFLFLSLFASWLISL